jgi:DNA-binding transcriptional regulator YhcF (GntR family)
MAKTAKKTAAKKPAKKSVKKVAKKSAKAGAKKAPAKKAGASKPRGDTKVSKVIAKMKNGGITRAEVLKMTGWKAVSMQQLAESAGVNLKISAERPFTYKC